MSNYPVPSGTKKDDPLWLAFEAWASFQVNPATNWTPLWKAFSAGFEEGLRRALAELPK